jgi:hypothetical protein
MIQITQRIHLLYCVVPAATVRAGEAPGIGERAVPAEMPDWEAGRVCFEWLAKAARRAAMPLSDKTYTLISRLMARNADAQRTQSGIGGNVVAQRHGEERP